MELCGYYFHFGPFLRVSDFVGAPKDLLVLLEKEGYLLSTEDCSKGGRKDELVIKIQGFPTFENGNEIFCIGNH